MLWSWHILASWCSQPLFTERIWGPERKWNGVTFTKPLPSHNMYFLPIQCGHWAHPSSLLGPTKTHSLWNIFYGNFQICITWKDWVPIREFCAEPFKKTTEYLCNLLKCLYNINSIAVWSNFLSVERTFGGWVTMLYSGMLYFDYANLYEMLRKGWN